MTVFASVSVRLPIDLVIELDHYVKENKFKDRSEAIRKYIELGKHVENYKESIGDPEFNKKLEEMIHNEKIFDWITTLSDTQLKGIRMAIQMEEEGRNEQR